MSVTICTLGQREHDFLYMSEFESFNLLVCEKKENARGYTPPKMCRGEGETEEEEEGGVQSLMQRTPAKFSPLCCLVWHLL